MERRNGELQQLRRRAEPMVMMPHVSEESEIIKFDLESQTHLNALAHVVAMWLNLWYLYRPQLSTSGFSATAKKQLK